MSHHYGPSESILCHSASPPGGLGGPQRPSSGASLLFPPSSEQSFEYPLLAAAEGGDEHKVHFLLESSVDVNGRDPNGWSALIMAAKEGHVGLVQTLLDARAVVNPPDCSHTALRGAALSGHVDCVRLLLAAAADPQHCSAGGRTPLMGAAMNGHASVVAVLCSAGADKKAVNEYGETALGLAEARGHMTCVATLQATGQPRLEPG